MKKVIIRKEEATVDVASVSGNKYYGATQLGAKGFIIRTGVNAGPYKILSNNHFTQGNGWSGDTAYNGLAATIREHIRIGGEVYEFETSKDLFTWLAQS